MGPVGPAGPQGGVQTLPYIFDNTSTNYALLEADGSDNGWTGFNHFFLIEDGLNPTVYVNVSNQGGGNSTAILYDNGGATGYKSAVLAQVLLLNLTAGDLQIHPVYERMMVLYSFGTYPISIGTTLYLRNSNNRHDQIAVRACHSVGMDTAPVVAGDTVTLGTTVFTAVTPGPAVAANQEFLDEAAAGTAAAVADSFAAAVNAVASQALLLADLGFAVSAVVPADYPGRVVLDSLGQHFNLSHLGNAESVPWTDVAAAIVVTPGQDMT